MVVFKDDLMKQDSFLRGPSFVVRSRPSRVFATESAMSIPCSVEVPAVAQQRALGEFVIKDDGMSDDNVTLAVPLSGDGQLECTFGCGSLVLNHGLLLFTQEESWPEAAGCFNILSPLSL